MLAIRFILFLSAAVTMLYPMWGVIEPTSYQQELIETFPFAQDASTSQVRQSSILLLLPNLALAVAFIFIAKFIASPVSYHFAKIAAFALMAFPLLQTIGGAFIGSVLSQHTEGTAIAIEFSGQKLFYLLFGLAILGMSKSQYQHHKLSENE